jgi:hypothetical protein
MTEYWCPTCGSSDFSSDGQNKWCHQCDEREPISIDVVQAIKAEGRAMERAAVVAHLGKMAVFYNADDTYSQAPPWDALDDAALEIKGGNYSPDTPDILAQRDKDVRTAEAQALYDYISSLYGRDIAMLEDGGPEPREYINRHRLLDRPGDGAGGDSGSYAPGISRRA